MMISPDGFYAANLEGKTPEQILTVIRSLKRKINRLKYTLEHPDYTPGMCPGKDVQLSCTRDYLECAKQALVDAGGIYTPTAAEQKAADIDANLPYVSRVRFDIGGYFVGSEVKIITINGDRIYAHAIHSQFPIALDTDEAKTVDMDIDKDTFLAALKDLHPGEWRHRYDPQRFGYMVCDGTQWELEISFSNGHKPVKIYGNNAAPYNFDQILELFDVDSRWSYQEK